MDLLSSFCKMPNYKMQTQWLKNTKNRDTLYYNSIKFKYEIKVNDKLKI